MESESISIPTGSMRRPLAAGNLQQYLHGSAVSGLDDSDVFGILFGFPWNYVWFPLTFCLDSLEGAFGILLSFL